MSAIVKSPAELFEAARSAHPDLRGVTLESSAGDAIVLRQGGYTVVVQVFRETDPRVRQVYEMAVARGAGCLLIVPSSDVPPIAHEFALQWPHYDYLEPPIEPQRFARHLTRIFKTLRWEDEARAAQLELQASRDRLKEIQQIGIALSAERDLDRLLNMIVEKARHITHADAGSLYIVENGADGAKRLRFKISQNDSIETPFSEFTLPINTTSLAGYVAATSDVLNIADVYHIPEDAGYKFNRSFDDKFHYRTKSMLVVPMINRAGELVGVLQLINRKRNPARKLTPETAEAEVISFSPADAELVESLSSAAAVSLENAFLYEEIHRLFEGFVRASVTAIESRDPTTSGHSGRVATLTVGLAQKVDRVDSGRLAVVRFSRQQLREIEYASLLHDFGKIGVREEVLLKAEKLYPGDFKLIEARFKFIKKAMEAEYLRRQNELLLTKGKRVPSKALRELDEAYKRECAELDRYFQVICEANRPTILAEGNFEILQQLAQQKYRDLDGRELPLLTEYEVLNLSLPKGSLNEAERREIESHVTHTFSFLQQIPWTKELADIPQIAFLHHEKLNGRGYPNGVAADAIPVQSRMMTIADIYDALTASDRPYKKAVPAEKALSILEQEVKEGLLDADLFRVFVEAEVYRLTMA